MEIILKVSAALEMKLETGCGVAHWQRIDACKSFEIFCFSEMILFNLTKCESKAFVFPSFIPLLFSLCVSLFVLFRVWCYED